MKPVRKVLFVCYANGSRSIMAEALARHFWGNTVEVWSAGLNPMYVPSTTLEALKEAGISTDGLHSKGFSDVPLRDIDYLVNLAEYEIDHLVPSSFSGKLLPFPVKDPYFGQGIVSYRQVRDELKSLILEKLPDLIGI